MRGRTRSGGARRRRHRALLTAVAASAAALSAAVLLAPPAWAHGIVGRKDVPIPDWLFGWAAAVVLVVSFVALAVLWREPRLEHPRERRLLRIPVAVDVICGALGVAAFAVVVYAGFAGSQTATANLAPTAIFVLFWVGFVVVNTLLGDVFRAFNPWLAVARAVSWLSRRFGGGAELPPPFRYPDWLGRWPAAVGILAFAWVELALDSATRDDPSTLALLALLYFVAQLAGMALFGIERWSERADPFGVYFNLFARLAPLVRHDRELMLRPPLGGLASLGPLPGTVALLCVVIGSTAFDGASEGSLWTSIAPDIQQFFVDLGFSVRTALELAFTVGLVAGVLLVAAVYGIGVLGMRTVRGAPDNRWIALARRFAMSLVPIGAAYVVAHYFSLLVYQGQATGYLISDPLGDGSDLFGTANVQIDYGVISATGIWYVQVGALVIGHVAALVMAHDRALVTYDDPGSATRSQYWMLIAMVAFTSLGLWLLSQSNA